MSNHPKQLKTVRSPTIIGRESSGTINELLNRPSRNDMAVTFLQAMVAWKSRIAISDRVSANSELSIVRSSSRSSKLFKRVTSAMI